MASAQFFSFSRKFELRREDSCAQVHHTMDWWLLNDSLSGERGLVSTWVHLSLGRMTNTEYMLYK
jgi:hypothetical protein